MLKKSGSKIVKNVRLEVKKQMMNEATGHDWWHIERVYKMARRIVKEEGVAVNLFILDLASFLHDLDDWKFSNNYSKTK